MSKKPRPPSLNALKHGGYSNLGLLPGEDPDEYNEHHRQNRLEWRPAGLSEEAIVTHMGDLLWREKNLAVYQLFALLAKKWELVLAGANEPGFSLDDGLLRILKQNLVKIVAHLKVADRVEAKQKLDQGIADFTSQAKEVLQKAGVDTDQILTETTAELVLVLAAEGFSLEQLMRDIEVRDRLHASYARSIKLLFETKGWKAVAGLTAPPDPPRQVTGPKPGEEVSAGAPASSGGNSSESAVIEPTVVAADATLIPDVEAALMNNEPREMPIEGEAVPEPVANEDGAGTRIGEGSPVAGAD